MTVTKKEGNKEKEKEKRSEREKARMREREREREKGKERKRGKERGRGGKREKAREKGVGVSLILFNMEKTQPIVNVHCPLHNTSYSSVNLKPESDIMSET